MNEKGLAQPLAAPSADATRTRANLVFTMRALTLATKTSPDTRP